MKKKKLFLIPLAMFMAAGAVGLASCDEAKKDDPSGPVDPVDPVDPEVTLLSIEVTTAPTKVLYQVGEQLDLTGMVVTAKYSDESEKVVTDYTVDKAGVALQESDTVVTVSYGGQTAAFNITVTSGEVVDVTGIKYTIAKYTIEIGETLEIGIEIEPEDATVKDVTYELSAEGIVSIEDNIITGLAEGSVDITIKSVSNPEVSKKISGFKVKKADVQAPAATAAGFNKFTEGTLKNGETINIAAIYGDKIYGMGALAGTFITPTELSVDGDGKLVVGEALNYKALLNNDGTYSLKDSAGKYLSLAASGNNIAIKEVVDEDCKFVIGHGENGVTTIVGANTAKESRFLVYNAGNPRFSFYKESTASGYPQLIVYHDGKEAEKKAVTGVEFKAASYEVDVNAKVTVAAGVLPEDATDQEITYSLENVEPAGCATISGNVVTGATVGTAKVVATTHDGGFTTSVDLTVNPEPMPEHAGTADDPYTAADALIVASKLDNKAVTENSFYIKDTVTEVVTSDFSTKYGNISFYFGDFYCYRVFKNSLDGKFTSVDEIEVGDVVTLVAKITNYNGTLETSQNTAYTVDIKKPAIPATGISLNEETLSMEVGGLEKTLTATVTPEGASQEVSWESNNPAVATVDANGVVHAVAEGEATITATSVANTDLKATCVVTVSTASRVMTGITVEGPTKTEYTEGEALDLTGLVVKAVYDSGDPEVIETGYTTNLENGAILTLENTELVVSYLEFDPVTVALTINEVARQSLPYTGNVVSGALPEGWTGEGEPFASNTYYALKASGKSISAVKLMEAQTSVRVIVHGVCNGTTTDSLVTVYGLNNNGEVIEGVSGTFVPAKAGASTKATVDAAATDGVVMLNGTGITGVKVELTTKGHNYVITSVRITEPPVLVSSVSLDKETMSLEYPGSNGNLVATVLPDNAENKDVEWTVTGSSVTVVDGVVTPIAVGESTVTATAKDGSGKSDSCVVTVTASEKVLTGIAIATDPDKTSYVSGEKFDPTGMVVMANYEGLDPEPITDYTYSDDDLVAGQTSVVISYGGQTATVSITVAAAKGSSVDNPYTIKEVLAASASLADKEWLDDRVFVQGKVKGYAASSSNKYTLVDDEGTEFIVYKSALPAGDRACINDVVIMEGWVENFGGTIEMTSYNDAIHNDLPTTAAIVSRGSSKISLDSSSSENASVTFEETATNASEYSFAVEAKEGYQVSSVKFDGKVVEGKEGVYTVKVMGNSKILVETVEEGQDVISTKLFERTATTTPYLTNDPDTTNYADEFGANLSDLFNLTFAKNDCSNSSGHVRLNKNTIQIYSKAQMDLSIIAPEGKIAKIVSISITFSGTKEATVAGTKYTDSSNIGTVSLTDLDLTTFSVIASGSAQAKFTSMTIGYTIVDA